MLQALGTGVLLTLTLTQVDKYDWSVEEAKEFSTFLTPMLEFHPERRATALQCLNHPFLRDVPS